MKDKKVVIRGAGGGSKSSGSARQPVVAPDSIKSRALLAVLDLLGEGQIKGLVAEDQSIFIGGTPLGNADGSKNFEGFTWDFRDGQQVQSIVTGFPSVSTPFNVGIQVKKATPYTFTVSDSDADFVNVIVTLPALSSQNDTTGDVSATKVEYQFLLSVNNGPFTPVNLSGTTSSIVTINDKSRSKYQRQHNIPLPKPGSNYRIRMVRITDDSTSSYLQNDTYIDSYYEILDSQLTYPNSVMCGFKINAEQFSETPTRSYLVDGLYVQVPSNYTPETRTYTGVWDGSFKIGYTNNPAWVLRDILLNKRYGLGEFINPSQINSGKLYSIARYCDGMVTDGMGGEEPRFTINTVIAAQRDAYKVVQDICSVFRGMSYWANGAVQVTQDSPADPQYLFTNANVVDGLFNRVGSARKDRHSVVHVQWNDPLDGYKQKIEYVEDKDLINSIGYRKFDTIAFGCTSRAQAHRIGLWILYTESVETNIMTFEVGLEGVQCMPGDIVKIHDQYKAGKRIGGRLKSSTRTTCTLDSAVTIGAGSKISIQMPDGKFEEVALNQIGTHTNLTFATQLSAQPMPNAVWVITETTLVPQLARCVGVSQSETPGQFVISVVDHNPSKYASIEQGLNLETLPTTILDPTNSNPENMKIEEFTYLVAPGQLGTKLEVSWEGKAPNYYVSWRANSGEGASGWKTEQVEVASFTLYNAIGGTIYDFKVVGISVTGKLSDELVGTYTTLGTMNPPKVPTDLTAVGDFRQIILNWTNPDDVDFDYVEIYENTVDDLETAYYLDRTSSNTYTRTGIPGLMKYWYWVRSVNKRKMVSDFNSTAGTSAIAGVITKTDLDEELSKPIEDISDIKSQQETLAGAITIAQAAADDAKAQAAVAKAEVDALEVSTANQVSAINSTMSGLQTQVTSNLNSANTSLSAINSEITTIKSTANALQTQVNNNKTAAETAASGLQTQITNNLNSVTTTTNGLQTQINNVLDATEYASNKSYTKDQFIRVGRSLYQAKINVPSNTSGGYAPPNATYWRDAGSVISSSDGLAARVTTAETNIGTINGTLTSQATDITGIKTTLNGKAEASALTALTTRVTAAEGVNTSQGDAITNLTNSVAGKADASAVTALTTRVTAAENSITSMSSSLTSVQATLGNLAGNGSNMLPSEYSWLTSSTLPTIPGSSGTNVVGVAVAAAISGFGYKFTSGTTSNALWFMLCPSNNAAGWNIPVEPGVYLVSFYASTPSPAASIRVNLWDGTNRYSPTVALSSTRSRYVLPITVSAASKVAVTLYPNMSTASGTEVIIDSVMIEKRIGDNNVASPFVAGPTAAAVSGLATATTALEARVTAAEGVNTSQATSITNINSALTGKADASALTALSTRVTATENSITSQGNSITSLTNSLAGKADTAALNALTTRVTSAEGSITSQGNSLTSVQATLNGIGGNGSNLLPAEYCVFGSIAPSMVIGGGITGTVEADSGTFNGYALKFVKSSGTGTAYLCSSTVYGVANMAVKPKKYLVSMYARASVDGHQFRAGFRAIQADGTVVFHYPSNMTVTTEWARYTTIIDLTASPAEKMILCIDAKSGSGAYGVSVWVDKIMVEEQIGTGVEPSAFVIGNSATQVNGLAQAQSALEARVTAAEGVNTSQSSSITSLTNSLGGKADASALTALTTRVTTAENTITSQGNSITSLNNSVAGKADTSALNALTTRVTSAENSISSQSSSITSIQATVNNIAGNGVNMLPATWSWITSTDSIPLPKGSNLTLAPIAIAAADSGFGVQSSTVSGSGSVTNSYFMYCNSNNAAGYNIRIEPGTYLVSMYVKSSAEATFRVSLYNGTHRYSADQIAPTVRTRMTFPVTVTDSAKVSVTVYPNRTVIAGITTEIDSVMIERRIGENNTPSAFAAGPNNVELVGLAAAQTSLDARVTAAEGVNTSQSNSITSLTNSLTNKADASALTALTTRVTTAENTLTTQGTSITNLNNAVAGKADTSALTALTTRVTTAENNITSQSGSITTLTATLGNIAGAGTNLLPSEYSWLASTTLPAVNSSLSTRSSVAVAEAPSGFGYYIQPTSNSLFSYLVLAPFNSIAYYNLALEAGTYLVSMYAKGDTAGQVMANLYDGTNSRSQTLNYTTTRQRLTFVITLPAAAKSVLLVYPNRQGANPPVGLTVDSIMIEKRVGENNTPSPFVAGAAGNQMFGLANATSALDTRLTSAEGTITSQGNSITSLNNSLTNKADVSALNALTTRVTAAEGVNTSQGTSITNLNASVGGIAQEDCLMNSTFAAEGVLKTENGSAYQMDYANATDAGVPANPPAGRLLWRLKKTADTGWGGTVLNSTNTIDGVNQIFSRANPGDVINLSCHMFCENAVANAGRIAITPVDANGDSGAVGNVRILSYVAATGGWQALSAQYTIPAGYYGFRIYVVPEGVAGINFKMWVGNLKVTRQTAGEKALATATSALDARVTAAEGVNTSQASSLTNLTSMIGQQPDNLILKGTFEDGDVGPWTAGPLIANVTAHPSYSKAIQFMSNSFCGTTRNIITRGGEEFDCSADVWNNYMTAGQTTRLQIQFYDKDVVNLGYYTAFTVYAGTSGFVTYSGRITAPAGSVTARFVIRHETTDGTGRSLWCNIVARRVTAADTANAAATTALTTRVTAAEGAITSQSSSITTLTANLNAIGGTGSNMVPAEYSVFTDTAPTMVFGAGITGGVEVDTAAFSGYALKSNKASGTGTIYFAAGSTYATSNMQVKQKKYIVSAYIKAAVAGHQVKFGVRGIKADGTVTAFHYSGNITVTDTWARYSAVIDMSASLADKMCFCYDSKAGTGAYNVNTWIDRVMIEEQIGTGTEPGSFMPGNSANQIAVQGAALSSLTTRVTTAEGTITSQGNSITSLNNSVAGKADTTALNALTTRVTTAENSLTSQGTSITSLTAGLGNISGNGANLLPSQYSWLTSTTLPQTNGSATTTTGVAVAGSITGFGYKMVSTSASTGCYLMLCPLNTAASHNINLEAGTYIVSFWASSPATATLRIRVYGVTTSAYSVQTITLTPTRTRYAVTVTLSASATYAVLFYYNQSGIAGTEVTADSVMIERQIGTGAAASTFSAGPSAAEVAGLASAQSALDARVTAAEGVNTSQATSITNLNTSVAGKADNSALTALTTRVTTAENNITSQSSSVTALQATLGGIGGSGSNLNPSEYSVFGPNAPVIGAISTGLTYSVVADAATLGGYALKIATSNTTTSTAVYLHASNTISAVGSFPISYVPGKYIVSFYAKASVAGHQVRAYLRGLNSADAAVNSLAPTFTLTTGWVRYSTVIDLAAATFSGSRMAVAFYPNHSGVSGRDIFFDRIMVEKQIADGTNPSAFDAGTSYTQAQAQATALNTLSATVTSQGNSITALTTQTNTIQTSLNNTTASVNTTSSALATLDGKLSSQWTTKVQIASNGSTYIAGMGVGIQTTDQGITQSLIQFQADRVVMFNPANNYGVYPFQLIGGVVYLSSAVIQAATITNAIIGQTISSAAQTNWGGPVMATDYNQGLQIIRHPTMANTYTVYSNSGIQVVVSGVLRVRMGVW